MKRTILTRHVAGVVAALGFSLAAMSNASAVTTVTIGMPNNNDMLELKKLSPIFEKANPDIQLKWVVLEENTLRQRLTTDIATNAGQFDLAMIGMYEAPIWGSRGWLTPMTDFNANYDIDDVFKTVRDGLSSNGKLYALPFNAESTMTFYRKDLFQAKGLKMPDQPTYDQIAEFADKLNNPSQGVYGICLRGKAGWGENMAYVSTLINTFGGRWFDEKWVPQINTPEWKKAVTFYSSLMKKDGPPGASSNGFNENLSLMAGGKCAIWVDATSAAGILYNKAESSVSDKVGFAQAPIEATPNGSHWLWSWGIAIPKTSRVQAAARRFAEWATSKEYIQQVGKDIGYASLPPGTRKSTYDDAQYKAAAPFSDFVLKAINTADPLHPTQKQVPYTGIQFVGIPEFQAIGTAVGQQVAGVLAGSLSVDQALQASQAIAERAVKSAGYQK
ncbi:ABC transporter substrate-binding protein [Paraburkholderia flava]|uniref:ABC transporter substrate-binding protein n=1 Tax=Paraburkholderia flava TaxID=2547393 RepID=UPI0010607574|nr:sugar ABC transporter substrate-binding protein [Paraburkholderia flava]